MAHDLRAHAGHTQGTPQGTPKLRTTCMATPPPPSIPPATAPRFVTRGVKAVPCAEDHPSARPYRGVCSRCARRERRRRGTLCNTCVRSVAPGAGAGQASPPPAPPLPPHTWRSGALPPSRRSRRGSRAPRRRDSACGWRQCSTPRAHCPAGR